ncbi:MAG: TSUP family transporter [Enterobacteriaceae bacterium]
MTEIAQWFPVAPTMLAVLFLVALLAGFIDAIAGGGGLLTIPALLAAGIPPVQTLATNKLQSVGGAFSASLYFIRRGVVDIRQHKLAIACAFVGSFCGAFIVQQIDTDLLRYLLPVLLIAIAFYFLLTPQLGVTQHKQRLSAIAFALLIGGGVGFYDGFLGPGTGSFFALAYVTCCGFTLAHATAHAKVLNCTTNLAALLLFILSGKVIWSVGLVMLVGQFIGARIGATLVLSRGQKLIRPMIITMSLLMSIKLLYDNHGEQLMGYIQQLF